MKRILVIDDSSTIRKAIRRILESLGHSVTEVEDGDQALHVLGAGDPFDAVLCDIDMPIMDGLELLRALQIHPTIDAPPIIMCTTHTSFDKVETALTLGAMEYIMKPFDATIIESKLEACGVR